MDIFKSLEETNALAKRIAAGQPKSLAAPYQPASQTDTPKEVFESLESTERHLKACIALRDARRNAGPQP